MKEKILNRIKYLVEDMKNRRTDKVHYKIR